MLAAPPLNARIQALVPPHSIFKRSSLRPNLAKRTFRARNGPAIVQRAQLAPKGAPPSAGDLFYNRVTELDYFKEKLSGTDAFVTVLVGPRNCGKTKLLEKLAQQYEVEKIGPLFLYIDGRLTPVRNPDEVAKALTNALETSKLQRLVNYTISSSIPLLSTISINAGLIQFSLGALVSKLFGRDEIKLEPTVKKFEKLCNALEPLPTKPVIVIDEANKLMDWKEPDPLQPELQQLLSFLVSISKAKGQAHVVLATSDYFLANWLNQVGMTEDKFEVEVLGDLTEEEAQKFFKGDGVAGGWRGVVNIPSGTKKVPAGAQEQWPAIYERCGGNIGLLKRCVAAARLSGNWDSALQTVVAGPLDAVKRGFKPEVYIVKGGEAPLWIDEQWRMVLERITTAPHHAVLACEIEEELGKGSGKRGSTILWSMVKYNLLALRPHSTLARDLPQKVYKNEGVNETVVTLPLPAHVWAAKAVLKAMTAKEAKRSAPQL